VVEVGGALLELGR